MFTGNRRTSRRRTMNTYLKVYHVYTKAQKKLELDRQHSGVHNTTSQHNFCYTLFQAYTHLLKSS